MRIAMIGQKGMPAIFGGVERHVHELAVRLVKRGHKITVYSRPWYSGPDRIKNIEGVQIKFLPSIHTKHLDTISHTLVSTIHAILNRYDVIHYHGVGPSLLSWLPRIFTPKTKVIVTFHSIDRKHRKWNWFARLALWIGEWTACNFPHHTIAVSQTIAQYIRDLYDVEALLIPNGAPECQKTLKIDQLEQWGLKHGSYLLLVSRLIPHKGIHYAIGAYQSLKKNQAELIKDIPLVIVGDGYYTGQYVKDLKMSVANDPQIIFTGFQTGEALQQLYSHALLMIHPSDNEGMPITVLEGMSYGLPILVSDIQEHKKLIRMPGHNFIRGDVQSLIERLAGLLQKDTKELQNCGMANQERALNYYGWPNIVEQTINLYTMHDADSMIQIA